MWKVMAMFNETDEEGEESTFVVEQIFDTYGEMYDYVNTCQRNGAVGGFVLKSRYGIWIYYMDV